MSVQRKERDAYWDVVKGIAILGVITIHFVGDAETSFVAWLFRQLSKGSVFVFVFLVGYFAGNSSLSKDSIYVKRRITRLIVPYAIWSVVSVAIWRSQAFLTPFKFLWRDILLGGGIGIGYYVIMLLQLTVMTPLFASMIVKRTRHVFISTVALNLVGLMLAYFAALGIVEPKNYANPVPYPAIFAFVWMVPYVLGLFCGRFPDKVQLFVDNNRRTAFSLFAVSLISIFLAAIAWKPICLKLAGSQTTVSAFLFSTLLCLGLISFKRTAAISRALGWLAVLGRGSFFIYLTHMRICFPFVRYFLGRIGVGGEMTLSYYALGMTMIAFWYYLCVYGAEKILPKKICSMIGVS